MVNTIEKWVKSTKKCDNQINGDQTNKRSRRFGDPMSHQFKVADAKRLIGAVQKKGLKVKSVAAAPDGTLTISVARPAPPQLSADVERDLDKTVSEWDKVADK